MGNPLATTTAIIFRWPNEHRAEGKALIKAMKSRGWTVHELILQTSTEPESSPNTTYSQFMTIMEGLKNLVICVYLGPLQRFEYHDSIIPCAHLAVGDGIVDLSLLMWASEPKFGKNIWLTDLYMDRTRPYRKYYHIMVQRRHPEKSVFEAILKTLEMPETISVRQFYWAGALGYGEDVFTIPMYPAADTYDTDWENHTVRRPQGFFERLHESIQWIQSHSPPAHAAAMIANLDTMKGAAYIQQATEIETLVTQMRQAEKEESQISQ